MKLPNEASITRARDKDGDGVRRRDDSLRSRNALAADDGAGRSLRFAVA